MAHPRNSRAYTRLLSFGILMVPACYIAYTFGLSVNEWCHRPYTQDGYLAHEIAPYVFILGLVFMMVWFGFRALVVSDHIAENFTASLLTLVSGIFGFALIYFTYGLQEDTGYLTPLPDTDGGYISMTLDREFAEDVFVEPTGTVDYVEEPPTVVPPPQPPGAIQQPVIIVTDDPLTKAQFPLVVLEHQYTMVDSPWDHVLFSLSNAIPGVSAYDYRACPSASHFVLMQNIFGLAITIILAILANRLHAAPAPGPAPSRVRRRK